MPRRFGVALDKKIKSNEHPTKTLNATMMKTNLLIVLIITLFLPQNILADSPLTSISISKAYEDSKIVQLASEANGKLTVELMNYLSEAENPIELKIAVINKLGWDTNGKRNSSIFFQYLKEKYGYKTNRKFIRKASGDLLICMAYLKAMDNYFDVEDAIAYARKAKLKNKKSYTTHIIAALIEAQKVMNSDWCEVYTLANNVRINKTLISDMKINTINIIFDYMDKYKENCE